MHEYRYRRRIEFSDTDMAGIVHFSRFYVFMETAEHRFLNELGTSVHTEVDGQSIGWPRVKASCEFYRPLRFEDELEVVIRVVRKGTSSITWAVEFLLDDQRIATGELVTACCVLRPGDRPRSCPIPAFIADRIEVVPPLEE